MTQFLKSILFPNLLIKKKSTSSRTLEKKIALLEARIILLEEENKKSSVVIDDLSRCIQTFSILMTDIAQDVTILSTLVKELTGKQSSYNDDIISRYLDPDDDDGYLN